MISHAQAVDANYRLKLDLDKWVESGERRTVIEQQTERYAGILERAGIESRLDRAVMALGSVTGAGDFAEGYRNSNVLPLVASRNRRAVLRDLQFWMQHKAKRPVRYAVVTFGERVGLFGDLRERTQVGHRRVSKWAAWAKKGYGVHMVGRYGELTVDEGLSLHPHANVVYWLERPLSKERWTQFLKDSYSRFGAHWRDNGVVRDVSEVIKYFAKGDDLALLADMACQVRAWADREVPQAALIEAMAARIAAKRSGVEKRRVEADECLGFAVGAVNAGVKMLRDAAEQGKPHPLVWLFHELQGLHLCQSVGDLQQFRRQQAEDGVKVAFIALEDGTGLLRQKEKQTRRKRTPEEEAAAKDCDNRQLIIENRVLAVTMPQPRNCPWAEEIIYIENFTADPKTEKGWHGLRFIHDIQDRARKRWEAAGSPDPAYALSIAVAARAEAAQGGTRAPRGGFLPGFAEGPGGGEADAAPYRPHHNENCPRKNRSKGVHTMGDGTLVDRDTGMIVYRPPTYDELMKILDVEGAIARAAQVKRLERSLWWKLRNYEAWAEEEKEGMLRNNTELPSDYFLNDDEFNFFDVEGCDVECDITF